MPQSWIRGDSSVGGTSGASTGSRWRPPTGALPAGVRAGLLGRRAHGQLAGRADHVDARDLAPAAAEQTTARLRTAGMGDRVSVSQWDMRDPFPDARYDLVVFSEVLYYLEADVAAHFMAQVVEHLDDDGHVVVAHWQTRVPDYPLGGAEAQQIACMTAGLTVLAAFHDDDFSLDVLARTGAVSVATTTGLR